MKVDYRDSEKFRAEIHKFFGSSLLLPLSLDILNILVFTKEFILNYFLFELGLFMFGLYIIDKSYSIMLYRDINNV
jgi:hypothetical protein